MELSYEIYLYPMGQHLEIEGYIVGKYPISYTVDECLDDFCDEVKWKLDWQYFTRYNSYIGGSMMVERNPLLAPYRETLRAVEQKLI